MSEAAVVHRPSRATTPPIPSPQLEQSSLGYQRPDFRQRQIAANKAKSDQLAKFKISTSPDNPDLIERRAARQAIIEAREIRIAQREAARIAREKEAAEQAALEAERIAKTERDAAEAAARAIQERAAHEALLAAAEKSIRDTKRAARKGGKKQRREAWMKLTANFESSASPN